jgi:23S rRNA (uracil1939-C5)-methyltransferase
LGRRVIEQLTIVRLGHRGDGVADTAKGPVYVPYALPGEIVTVEPVDGHPDRRHLLHLASPSPDRSGVIPQHIGAPGGCVFAGDDRGRSYAGTADA